MLKLKNKKELSTYLLNYGKRIEMALILQLEYLVAELENHAKANAEYKDQTSNLKGSIGGIVLNNGRKVSLVGFDSDGGEGNTAGLEFINQLVDQNKKGYVIIIVAGMDYATYVENYHNLNVLKKTELEMRRELPLMLNRLKRKIDNLR